MSKSAILKSSIAKKWWMALTGLFLCLFLVGHLLGNLPLITKAGEEGRRAFNEYAYFMTHNPLIMVMSYLTYFSILFHAVDGILLTIQNKKARPIKYAYNRPDKNSATSSRYMGILGSAILIFIVVHMANFWWAMKHSSEAMPLHKYKFEVEQNSFGDMGEQYLYYTHDITAQPIAASDEVEIKNETDLYIKGTNVKIGEGYKDLHSQVMSFFGHDKSKLGFEANKMAVVAVFLYVISMIILAFHLWHGFASSFQTLGLNNKKFTPTIKMIGQAFAVLIPLAFAIIPVLIFMNK